MAGKRLADDVGEEAGRRLVRRARADADSRQPDADAVEKPLARVVGDQHLADRLLRAVGGQRRVEELVADLLREWRAEHGDRRGEDQPRFVAAANRADGVDQEPRAVEIDAIALIELRLGLAGHDRGEVEDRVRPVHQQRRGGGGIGEVGGDEADRQRRAGRLGRRDHVLQRHAGDLTAAEMAVLHKPFSQLAADHAGGAEDEDMQGKLRFLVLILLSFLHRPGHRRHIMLDEERVQNHQRQ